MRQPIYGTREAPKPTKVAVAKPFHTEDVWGERRIRAQSPRACSEGHDSQSVPRIKVPSEHIRVSTLGDSG
jgi:hypothetical protein